jgi:hypothetical protein
MLWIGRPGGIVSHGLAQIFSHDPMIGQDIAKRDGPDLIGGESTHKTAKVRPPVRRLEGGWGSTFTHLR